MCGIYGVLHPARDLEDGLPAMRSFLRHRGPDGEGVAKVRGGLLGHLRLSIIDLSPAAAQPLWDAERRACVVFNGEIYNYRELREECRRAGMSFLSESDTEAIVNQYLLHGEAAFDRLNGIFALCLFDARSGDFYLVRDHMGVKPLYYAETGDGLFFASELKALVRTGVAAPRIDPAALQAYLQLDFVPAPLSIIEGVRKLREGHLLHASPSGRREVRCYSRLAAPVPDRRAPLAEDAAEFDRLIRRAVERQLVADVPLGVFLSGGIDSSIVARAAVEVSGRRVATFSIGFEDPSFDESRYFDEVARAVGTDHHSEILGPRAMLDLLPLTPHVACEPLADGSIFPTYLLCRFARRHVTVALSGDGADELFGGYPTYTAARLASPLRLLPLSWSRALAAAAARALPVSYDNFSPDFKVKKLLEGLHPDPILRNHRWLGSFPAEELPRLLQRWEPAHQRDLEAMLREPAEAAGDAPLLERILRTDQRFYLQDEVLVKVDRASMASSLEVRVPFLDPEMVAFARSLPPERKLRGRRFKILLKHHARGRLPDSVVARPKKGFGTPLGKWFRKELKDLLGDALAPRRLEEQGYFRGAYVGRLLEDHWAGRRDNRKLLFNLLAFSLWHDTLKDPAPPALGKP
jgi:asparagine synthase (glutamine-hydrolysing)